MVELSVLDYDSADSPYFALPADGAVLAVALPADVFEWPPTIVSGVRIHTLSPLALIQIRSGGMSTGAFGPPRSRDATRQARLIETFFPGSDPTSLEPRITTIGELEKPKLVEAQRHTGLHLPAPELGGRMAAYYARGASWST